MTKSSSVNTWNLIHMVLWCMGLVSSVWMCVGVQCEKSGVLSIIFEQRALFIKRSPKLKMFRSFRASPSPYDNSLEKDISDAQDQGKKGGPKTQKAQSYQATLLADTTHEGLCWLP